MRDRVLVVGSGGREHALAWKLAQSPAVDKLFIAPGNPGTSEVGENVPIDPMDSIALARFAENNAINLTVVGPEKPLAKGIVNTFNARGLPIFGPIANAAELEGSKISAKELMKRSHIPTADSASFFQYDEALAYVRKKNAPCAVKASGLANGKGVYLCANREEAEEALQKIMVERVHGDAGYAVVVEDMLYGQEVSIHALCDIMNFELFPLSQDHKRAYEGDKGPMTGGMGAIAPLPHYDAELTRARIGREIIDPFLADLRGRSSPIFFRGCFYPGVMMTDDGPMVLEINVRFGDPEMQVYAMLLESDLYGTLFACARGTLKNVPPLSWRKGFAVCVVLAAPGYPGAYAKGSSVKGLVEAGRLTNVVVFHAGTAYDESRTLVTSGGRVLGVTAFGKTVDEAIGCAYEAAAYISFKGKQYRRDIGAKARLAVM